MDIYRGVQQAGQALAAAERDAELFGSGFVRVERDEFGRMIYTHLDIRTTAVLLHTDKAKM